VDHFEGEIPCAVEEFFTGSRSIAKEVCLSVETISRYRANILLKTRMKYNAEITYYAIQNKPAG
jgi:two-component system invasion response regulator UvrY